MGILVVHVVAGWLGPRLLSHLGMCLEENYLGGWWRCFSMPNIFSNHVVHYVVLEPSNEVIMRQPNYSLEDKLIIELLFRR